MLAVICLIPLNSSFARIVHNLSIFAPKSFYSNSRLHDCNEFSFCARWHCCNSDYYSNQMGVTMCIAQLNRMEAKWINGKMKIFLHIYEYAFKIQKRNELLRKLSVSCCVFFSSVWSFHLGGIGFSLFEA